jgi:hypothetical protein
MPFISHLEGTLPDRSSPISIRDEASMEAAHQEESKTFLEVRLN